MKVPVTLMDPESQSLFKDTEFRAVWSAGFLIGVVRWLEFLAVGIYAFDVTGSAFLTALLALLRFLPLALFGVVIGALADLLDTRKLLRIAITLGAFVSAVITALFLLNIVTFWHVALATFISGAVWASDLPLRRKLIGEIAGPERLGTAMAIDAATSNNGSRLLGPLIGGAVYQWTGGAGVFLVCTALYFLSYLIVFRIRRSTVFPTPDPSTWLLRSLLNAWQAFRFATTNREVMALLSVTVVFNIWGFPMLSMVPVIGKEELELSASSIGVITAMEGTAAFIGSIIMARIASPHFYRMIYYYSVWAVLVIVFLIGVLPSTMTVALGLIGFGLAGACFSIMQSTLIYLVAPAEMRGRLLGVMTICIGSGVIGYANIGFMADIFGGSNALWMVSLEGFLPMIIIGIGWHQFRGSVRKESKGEK